MSVVVLLLLLSGYRAYFVHHCVGLGDCGKFSENFSALSHSSATATSFSTFSASKERKLLETKNFALLLLPLAGSKKREMHLKSFCHELNFGVGCRDFGQ